MKRKWKGLLAFWMAVVMLCGMMPVGVLATDMNIWIYGTVFTDVTDVYEENKPEYHLNNIQYSTETITDAEATINDVTTKIFSKITIPANKELYKWKIWDVNECGYIVLTCNANENDKAPKEFLINATDKLTSIYEDYRGAYDKSESYPNGTPTYPIFTPVYANKWSVNLVTNEGQLESGKEVTYYVEGVGVNLPKADDITRTGYKFEGWYSDSEFKGNMLSAIGENATGNKTYYAKWTANSYNATFNANGGHWIEEEQNSDTKIISVPYGSEISKPKDPTRTGYTFTGWTPEGESMIMDSVDGKEFNAKWEKDYIINYSDGTASQTLIYNANEITLNKSTDNTKVGYTFKGWSTEPDGETEYSVDSNGSIIISSAVIDEFKYNFKSDATADDYRTLTLYPVWQANGNTPYSIMYYRMNFSGDYEKITDTTYPSSGSGITGNTITITPEIEEGFTIAYNNKLTGTIKGDGSLVLEVYYSRNKYKLEFNADGGEGGNTSDVYYGAAISAPEVSKTGHSLKNEQNGWSPAVPATMPAEDVTYTAQWQPKEYIITFDGNGGTYTVDSETKNTYSQAFTYNVAEQLGENKFSCKGKYFAGWSYTQSGEILFQDEHNVKFTADEQDSSVEYKTIWNNDSNVTLYAIWSDNPTVTFEDKVHNTQTASQIVEKDGYATEPTAPSCEGYEFIGWYTAAGVKWNFTTDKVGENVTLYAKWEKVMCEHDGCGCGDNCEGEDCKCDESDEGSSIPPEKRPFNPFGYYTIPGLFRIHFETGDGSEVDTLYRAFGTSVYPNKYTPELEGYTFTGWYADPALTRPVKKLVVAQDTVLYAGWEFIIVEEEVPETEASDTADVE